MHDLLRIEWFGQDDIGSQVQGLGPQVIIGVEEAERAALAVAQTRTERQRAELESERVKDEIVQLERKRQALRQEEALRRAAAEEITARKLWERQTMAQVLAELPNELPETTRGEAIEAARAKLATLSPDDVPEIVAELLASAIAPCLTPWRVCRQAELAMEAAMSELVPYGAYSQYSPTPHQIKAKRLVAETLSKSTRLLSEREFCALARQAVQPIVRQLEHDQQKARLLDSMSMWMLFQATSEEREEARQDAQEALNAAPPTASPLELERLFNRVLRPYQRDVEERIEQEREVQVAEQLVTVGLSHLSLLLFTEYRELDEPDAADLRKELPDAIREAARREGLAANRVRQFVEEWVGNEIESDNSEEWDDE